MSRNEHDAYFTPPPLTRGLLEHLDWPELPSNVIGEPCAGDGWISNELAEHGYDVLTADIDPQRDVAFPGVDFLSPRALEIFRGVDGIISNPPWNLGPQILRQALQMCPYVAMLMRLTFLEPCSKKKESARVDILRQLSRTIVCPRVSFIKGKKGTDSVVPVWLIFEPKRPAGTKPHEFITDADYARLAGQGDLFETR